MIAVDRAILHVFGAGGTPAVLSDEPLVLDDTVQSFLAQHLERCMKRGAARPGRFLPSSGFAAFTRAYLSGGAFVAFSRAAAGLWNDVLAQAEEAAPSALLVCDFRAENARYLALLRLAGRRGFVHRAVRTENGVRNDIAAHTAVLPSPGQSVEEYALLSAADEALLVSEKKYRIDGNLIRALSEAVLECTLTSSQREAVKAIRTAAETVAGEFGRDAVRAAASAKTAIAQAVEEDGELDPIRTGRAIFSGQPAMQEAFRQKMEASGFAAEQRVAVDREAVLKKVLNHRLKTDTGIELTIPAAYFDDTEYIEFSHAGDGSLCIMLKHIGSITNRG